MLLTIAALGLAVTTAVAQQPGPVTPPNLRNSPPMQALPATFDTAVQKIRVSAVASGLVNPWSLAFLPNGDMLVTERAGRLRLIHNGVLAPTPIAGVPVPPLGALSGLL